MKKLLVSVAIVFSVLLACLPFVGCKSSGKYAGKQYRMVDVSATYDETVSESVKTESEKQLSGIRAKLNGTDNPKCMFYKSVNLFRTDCNGNERFASYKEVKGKVEIDTSDTNTTPGRKEPIYGHRKYLNSQSLETAVFSTDGNKLLLSETVEGTTITYAFEPNGSVDESANGYVGETFAFHDLSCMVLKDNESGEYTGDESAKKDLTSYMFYGSVSFGNDEMCRRTTMSGLTPSINSSVYGPKKNAPNTILTYYDEEKTSVISGSWYNVYGDLVIFNYSNSYVQCAYFTRVAK